MRDYLQEHLLVLLCGIICASASLPFFISELMPGYDSASHVAKTAFLMYSWTNGNFLGWSGFWYSGFQLFDTYSPLFYVLAALIGWPLGSPILGVKLVIGLSFFIAGISVFALARSFHVSSMWSLVAGVLYIWSPSCLFFFYDYGSLTYSLAFALCPIVFLALRRMLSERSYKSSLLLGSSIAALVLSNSPTVYVLLYPLLTYFVLDFPKSKTKLLRLIRLGGVAIGVSFLLSAFWLVPYLHYGLSGYTDLFGASASTFPVGEIISIYSLFVPNLSHLSSGYLGYILIPALGFVAFLRRKHGGEVGLYVAALVSLFLTIGASLSPAIYYRIPLIPLLQFPNRFLIADILFLSVLAGIFFDRLSTWMNSQYHPRFPLLVSSIRLRRVVVIAICLMIVLPLVVVPVEFPGARPNFVPSSQSLEEKQAYQFLSQQPGYFRVMTSDRYYQWFPEFTQKASVDGWYDQAATALYKNFTYDIYYANPTDVNRSFNALRLLGVTYVMVYYNNDGNGPDSMKAYSSSAIAPPVFKNDQIAIFQVPNSRLIYVTGAALILDVPYHYQATVLGGIVKNPEFSPTGVVILNASCNEAFPESTCFKLGAAIPNDPINYSIADLSWTETRISFDLNISKPGYVLISSTYFPDWKATVDGLDSTLLEAFPSLSALYVPIPGLHTVTLYYQWGADQNIVTVLSSATWGAWILMVVLWSARTRNRNKRFKEMLGDNSRSWDPE